MTIYEAAGTEKPTVTKDDVDRLQLIEDQHEAIQHVVWNSPEPGPTAVLVFYAHDGISVVAHVLTSTRRSTRRKSSTPPARLSCSP